MATAAVDNAKNCRSGIESQGTPLHDACVVGDTVASVQDTSSLLNPIINSPRCSLLPWSWRFHEKERRRLTHVLRLASWQSRSSSYTVVLRNAMRIAVRKGGDMYCGHAFSACPFLFSILLMSCSTPPDHSLSNSKEAGALCAGGVEGDISKLDPATNRRCRS